MQVHSGFFLLLIAHTYWIHISGFLSSTELLGMREDKQCRNASTAIGGKGNYRNINQNHIMRRVCRRCIVVARVDPFHGNVPRPCTVCPADDGTAVLSQRQYGPRVRLLLLNDTFSSVLVTHTRGLTIFEVVGPSIINSCCLPRY